MVLSVDMYTLRCVTCLIGFSYSFASVNLALNRPTNQSSVFENLTSNRAVDGQYDLRPSELSCAVTQNAQTEKEAWWQVELNQTSLISHIHFVFENTRDIVAILQNHLVFVSDSAKIPSGRRCYKEKRNNPELINQVDCLLSGRYVTYFTNHLYNGNSALLLICEVEVYGCPIGYYGQNCKNRCSRNCANQFCEPDFGYCIGGCASGFSGDRCLQECDWGWFGPNCGVECSETCFGRACNSNNGTCIRCVPGRTGSFCNQIIGSGDGNITTDIGVDSASRTTSRTSIIDGPAIDSLASELIMYKIVLSGLVLFLIVVVAICIVFLCKYWRALKKQREMEKKFTGDNISSPSVVNQNLKNKNILPLPLTAHINQKTQDNSASGSIDPANSVNNRNHSSEYINDPLDRDSGLNYEVLKRDEIFPRESRHLYDQLQ